MVEIENCCLVVVDVQGKLAQLMWEKEKLFRNIGILIQAAKILDISIVWCQQVPDALGPTVPEIAELLEGIEPINKSAFSCCGDDQFNRRVEELGRQQVILCGIETHVCIYQTAADLLSRGFAVEENKQVGLERMAVDGANLSSVEMLLFELLKDAKHPKFRQIAKLVK
jgi:nicotinamidase-related amidase